MIVLFIDNKQLSIVSADKEEGLFYARICLCCIALLVEKKQEQLKKNFWNS